MNFDRYAEDYSARVRDAMAHAGHEVFVAVKAQHLLEIARRRFGSTSELAVLDVGCGVGLIEPLLEKHFRRLCGVDIAVEAIREAHRTAAGVDFIAYDGVALPFADEQFDIVFAVCVLHHVPPASWDRLIAEMLRTIRPGGVLAIFEHNPLNPAVRVVVSRCEFDRDAVLLRAGTTSRIFRRAGMDAIRTRYFLFFPWAARLWRTIERGLSWLPLGAQYYVEGEKPGRTSSPTSS